MKITGLCEKAELRVGDKVFPLLVESLEMEVAVEGSRVFDGITEVLSVTESLTLQATILRQA